MADSLEFRHSRILSAMSDAQDFFSQPELKNFLRVKCEYESVLSLQKKVDSLCEDVLSFQGGKKRHAPQLTFNISQTLDDFEDLLKKCKYRYFECEEQYEKSKLSVSTPLPQSSSRLSKIKPSDIRITPFNGDLQAFTEFKSMFDSLIHLNPDFTQEEKFYYFKSLLGPDCKKLIENLLTDPTLYPDAYKTLTEYYLSKRRQASFFLNEILNFKKSSSKKSPREFLTLRIVARLKPGETCRQSFRELKLLTLPALFMLDSVKFALRNGNFRTVREVTGRETRNANNLFLPRVRLSLSLQSASHMGARLFNSLPDDLKDLRSSKIFYTKLRDHLVEKCPYSIRDLW